MKMKILAISDTHNKHREYEKRFPFPLDCNTIIHAGDITSSGTHYEVNEFLDWFSSLYQFENKIFIAGNHDFFFENNDQIKYLIPDNVHYLENNGVDIWGVKFWGSPITPQFGHWAFMKERGEDISKYWKNIPDETDVLITHGPPYGILDLVPYIAYSDRDENPNCGCKDLFLELNRIRPKYHLFGHVHPSNGIWVTETCKFMNLSALSGNNYSITYPPKIFEIDI